MTRPTRAARRPRRAPALVLAALLAGCVTENAATGEPIPRGNQRYPFAQVQEAAERLAVGMSRSDVLLLLGSAAKLEDGGDTWVWLPERHAILVPARALQVRFEAGRVKDFGYRPIVFGADL